MKKLVFAMLIALVCVLPALAQERPVPRQISTDEIDRGCFEAIERTRTLYPGQYQQMMDACAKTRPGVLSNIGDPKTFTAKNFVTNLTYSVPATLRAKGPKSQIWVENAQWASNKVTQADVDTLLANLETQSSPFSINPSKGTLTLDIENFGNPPNKDGDSITDFLVFDILDGWTPGSTAGYIAGYFTSADQIGQNNCDLLYIDSYPGIYTTDTSPHTVDSVNGTMAHELQHLIHYRYHSSGQATWLNEAMSQAATLITGNPIGSSVVYYLHAPSDSLTSWHSNSDPLVLQDYAQVALWSGFLIDQFGVGILKSIVQNTSTGQTAANNVLTAAGSSFDLTYKDYLLALCLNNRAINTKYGFTYHYFENCKANADVNTWTYPASITGKTVPQYGLMMYRFTAGKNLNLTFTGTNCYAKLVKRGVNTINVVDLTSGSAYTDATFGTAYTEALVVVGSVSSSTSSFSISANATTTDIYELTHDDGICDNYITSPSNKYWVGAGLNAMDSGWAVQFDCPSGCNQLTKVSTAMMGSSQSTNVQTTVRMHIYNDNAGAPGTDFVTPVEIILKKGWTELDIAQIFGNTLTVPSRFYVGFTHVSNEAAPLFLLNKDTTASPVNYTWKINAGAAPQRLFDLKDASNNSYNPFGIMIHAIVIPGAVAPGGDLNHDGVVNMSDVAILANYLAGVALPAGTTVTDCELVANGGVIDAADLAWLQAKANGLF